MSPLAVCCNFDVSFFNTQEPSISRVTNCLVNITEDSTNIESEDVTLVSALLDRVTLTPESMSSGQAEEEATQVCTHCFCMYISV